MNILINESQYKRLFNPIVNFKVIGNVKGSLNESLSKQIFNNISSEVRKRLREINPFFGTFIDKNNKKFVAEFTITPTNHYIERTKRLSDSDYAEGGKKYHPDIKNPTIFEGIDLLVNNADELAKMIMTKRIKDDDMVHFSTKDGSEYHMIVKFEPRSLSEIVYNLVLMSQIKGVSFFDKKYQKSFSLYKKN